MGQGSFHVDGLTNLPGLVLECKLIQEVWGGAGGSLFLMSPLGNADAGGGAGRGPWQDRRGSGHS